MFEIKENVLYDKSELLELFGSETTLYRARKKGLTLRQPTGGRAYCLGSELLRFFSECDVSTEKGSDVVEISDKHKAKMEKTLGKLGRG